MASFSKSIALYGLSIAAKAVAFKEAESTEFVYYQKQVISNAKTLADTLNNGGLRLVSGGTDNHMTLVDVTPINISGKQAEEAEATSQETKPEAKQSQQEKVAFL